MSTKQHEIQGSDAWLAWRRTRGGASELPALMGCSPWMPRDARELWELKKGLRENPSNASMRHGSDNEAKARAWLEVHSGIVLEPQVVEADRLIASLDGQSFDGAVIAELKAPLSGRESQAWAHVAAHDRPSDHYWWQCQQQLLVSGAEVCIFAVYDAGSDDGILCRVYPDHDAFRRIGEAWSEFFGYLDTDTPPPSSRPEVMDRDDAEWAKAAQQYLAAKRALVEAQNAEKAAREALEALAGDCSAQGCGIALTRYWVQGSVGYRKAVPPDVDLERYRKAGRWQTRIQEQK